MEQISLFDELYPDFKITKPIRLIELFAGFGSQSLSMRYLGVQFEHWRICEWATKSIQAYNDLHIRDYKDYSKDLTHDEVIDCLFNFGISMNYNKPMTYEQIKRKSENWHRETYNNIIATHNLVNVQNVKATDLNIVDTDNYTYILTYSFPCQDISNEGGTKGLKKDDNTRSGMLWEVERLLDECDNLPQILIMENVKGLINDKFVKDFQQWELKLNRLGYSNYVKVLNAKNFKIPQKRERCFMVSILNNHYFNFPKEFKEETNGTDLLEKNVDFKTYQVQESIMNKLIVLQNEHEIGLRNGTKQGYEIVKKGYFFSTAYPTSKGRRGRVQKTLSPTLLTAKLVAVYTNEGFRYLTPCEYFKLMGVKKSDFKLMKKKQTENSLYHLAGDSIVTTCLMAIFGELLGIDYKTKINELVEDLKACS